jgi:hypothetical protein
VQFADAFLQTLLVGAVLRYLAVAHFGRGRGNYVDSEAPAFWQAEVEAALAHRINLASLWQEVRAAPDLAAAAAVLAVIEQATAATLARLYPGATSPRCRKKYCPPPCDSCAVCHGGRPCVASTSARIDPKTAQLIRHLIHFGTVCRAQPCIWPRNCRA